MKHLDLFSGIGGFAYAIDQIWEGVEHTFCEIDPFCQRVLKKHWKDAKIYGDIRQITADSESEQDRRLLQEGFFPDIITGGFPCQPFSCAGKRGGTNDNRYLWPEMLRVIRETKPSWVIAENVRGLLTIEGGVVFEQVCTDLEGEGYEVQPIIVPAVAVNAPHRRDRIWFVANKINNSDTIIERLERRPGRKICAEYGQTPILFNSIRHTDRGYNWEQNWLEVATKLCRMDDGVSAELDGLKLSKSAHRRERLKSLGNAIVPQVAVQIFRAIKYAEETR